MNYWLIKSEPDAYSWDQFVKDKTTGWTGVRNYAARNNLMAMKKGDLALFYHSNIGKEIVGIARVVKEHYRDATAKEGEWYAVDFAAHKALNKPVTLALIKSEAGLKNIELVRLSRLSVCKVSASEWGKILQLGETKS